MAVNITRKAKSVRSSVKPPVHSCAESDLNSCADPTVNTCAKQDLNSCADPTVHLSADPIVNTCATVNSTMTWRGLQSRVEALNRRLVDRVVTCVEVPWEPQQPLLQTMFGSARVVCGEKLRCQINSGEWVPLEV